MDTNMKIKLISIAYETNAEIYESEEMTILFVNKWEIAKNTSEKHKMKIGIFEKAAYSDYLLITEIQEPLFGNNGSFRSGDFSYRIGLYF